MFLAHSLPDPGDAAFSPGAPHCLSLDKSSYLLALYNSEEENKYSPVSYR